MRRCILFLLLCMTFVGAAAGAADYRYQALVDLDGDASTGCTVDGIGELPGGHELRIVAHADRAQVTATVLQSCHAGVWQEVAGETTPQAIALGQGREGSDRVLWSAPRSWFSAHPRLAFHLLAERVDAPAFDLLALDTQWIPLELILGDERVAVPMLGGAGTLLLLATLVCSGLYLLRRERARAWVWPLLALAMLGHGGSQHEARAAGGPASPASATDVGNDAIDAGADILQVEVVADGERVQFAVDVNDIEAAGLADDAKVLFIGNSLTYSNDLPSMLEAIAAQAGKRLIADAITLPGAALEDHFRARTAHTALANGGYQIVIMQQGPSSLPESQANLLEWSVRFEPRIRAGGARPALYMVWPDITRSAYFDDVRNAYLNAALEVDGMFIPAGEAWRAAWRSDPTLPLYDADQFHPSALGSYAAALSMFCELYRQSPVGLPPRLTLANAQHVEFDAAHAHRVQVAAWSAHREHGRAGE
jgi:hypothetical protein